MWREWWRHAQEEEEARPTRVLCMGGPSSPLLHVVSETDARLEAVACSAANQVYAVGRTSLEKGDTVIDVGANVGSFSKTASEMVGPQGRVVAIEPLPSVFKALRLNIAEHKRWSARQGTGISPITPMQCAVGARGCVARSVSLTYFPRCTALSTMYRDDNDAIDATLALVRNAHTSGDGSRSPEVQQRRLPTSSWLTRLAQMLARSWVGGFLYAPIHRLAFKWLYLCGAQRVQCRLMTLSDVIEEQHLSRVSLLKVNVERAEEDVLMSIEPHHLSRIDKVAMQVHDLGGRVRRLEGWLRRHGFGHVERWQEPRFKGSSLWMLYAVRQGVQLE